MCKAVQARRHVIKSGPAGDRAIAKGTSGESTRGVISPSCKGGSGDLLEKIFNLWLPLCAFLMHFGCVFAVISAVLG